MSTLERAIAIAADAHAGQVDKAGAPYILHPLRVMLSMDTDEERIVAVLHDVVEDCHRWSLSLLEAEGFNGGLVYSIDCLTRRKGESYEGFIIRCADHDRARKVKIADLRDNMDLNRFRDKSLIDWDRQAKYADALSFLVEREL